MRTALADQGDGPLDVHVIECAVAGGYGGKAAAADAVTAWIAETLRREIPNGSRRPGIPRVFGRRAGNWHASTRWVPVALTAPTRVTVITHAAATR